MNAVRERFGGLGGATRRWRGGGWLGIAVACALVMAGTGCKVTDRGDCLAPDGSAGCPALDDPGDPDSLSESALECDLTAAEGSARGICVEYVDAGWHTMLGRMAYLPKNQLRCPDSAPYPGLWGVEIRDDGVPPRNVIGCSVNPFPSCRSNGLACVPFEPDYPVCITQSDDPAPMCNHAQYTERTMVEEDGSGRLVTVCCRPPEQGPPG